jgi:hypothetical protein
MTDPNIGFILVGKLFPFYIFVQAPFICIDYAIETTYIYLVGTTQKV